MRLLEGARAAATFLPDGSLESVRWLSTNVLPLSKRPSTATTAPSHPGFDWSRASSSSEAGSDDANESFAESLDVPRSFAMKRTGSVPMMYTRSSSLIDDRKLWL